MKNTLNIVLLVVMLVLILLVLFLDVNKEQKVVTLLLTVVLGYTILHQTKNLPFETFASYSPTI